MQAPRESITKDIMAQMTTLGFLLLSNVSGYNEEELFKWQQWFFRLPKEVKSQLYKNHFKRDNHNYYRGFAPFIDNDPSHKELYEIGVDLSQVNDEEK
jgi:isopenicillin N synthase-like dioxygenase